MIQAQNNKIVVFKTLGACVRKFSFCARKWGPWKWFTLLKKTLSLLCLYCRNGTFVKVEYVYSVTTCKQEYLAKYPDLQIQKTSLEAHTNWQCQQREISWKTLSIWENCWWFETTRAEPTNIFDKIVSAARSSCCKMKLSNGSKALTKKGCRTFPKL